MTVPLLGIEAKAFEKTKQAKKDKIKALEKVIWDLRPYIRHAKHCTYYDGINDNPDNDFCTCDFNEIVEKVKKALAIKA